MAALTKRRKGSPKPSKSVDPPTPPRATRVESADLSAIPEVSCVHCKHWDSADSKRAERRSQLGQCLRYPHPISKRADQRCGEFAKEGQR